MEIPETRFAWNGDVALAYQVIGDGPVDIVYLQGYCSNVDMNWESPHLARFMNGLAGLGRLIGVDSRGRGGSGRLSPTDGPPHAPRPAGAARQAGPAPALPEHPQLAGGERVAGLGRVGQEAGRDGPVPRRAPR